jgi:hypothetical protein
LSSVAISQGFFFITDGLGPTWTTPDEVYPLSVLYSNYTVAEYYANTTLHAAVQVQAYNGKVALATVDPDTTTFGVLTVLSFTRKS